jgi:hypothetical protein
MLLATQEHPSAAHPLAHHFRFGLAGRGFGGSLLLIAEPTPSAARATEFANVF